MKIESIGEFGLIEELSRLLPVGRDVIKGIGDDAAVLEGRGRDRYLLVATDSIAEKIHFRRSAGAYWIGRKALAVNLSDIAAMGGYPLWAVVNLGLPAGLSVRYCRQLYRGMAELADEFDLSIVGGDTFRSPDGIVISVTVIGEVEKRRCVFRDGARPGDVICLTGKLGEGRGKHLRFIPRVKEGRHLAESFSPSAMIDISDGLFADIDKLCGPSGVGAVIGEAAIPAAAGLRGKSEKVKLRAIGEGEEFELLFTLPEIKIEDLMDRFLSETGTPVTPIGKVVEGEERRELIGRDGKTRPFPENGYNHF
jgi:thiamine-monophosphate kinase